MLRTLLVLLLISWGTIGASCAKPSRLIIPSSPQPTEEQIVALEACAAGSPHFVAIERRRVIHSCRLEILKQSDLASRCEDLIRDLERGGDE